MSVQSPEPEDPFAGSSKADRMEGLELAFLGSEGPETRDGTVVGGARRRQARFGEKGRAPEFRTTPAIGDLDKSEACTPIARLPEGLEGDSGLRSEIGFGEDGRSGTSSLEEAPGEKTAA